MMMMMDGMMMIHGIWDTSVDTVAQMCGSVGANSILDTTNVATV